MSRQPRVVRGAPFSLVLHGCATNRAHRTTSHRTCLLLRAKDGVVSRNFAQGRAGGGGTPCRVCGVGRREKTLLWSPLLWEPICTKKRACTCKKGRRSSLMPAIGGVVYPTERWPASRRRGRSRCTSSGAPFDVHLRHKRPRFTKMPGVAMRFAPRRRPVLCVDPLFEPLYKRECEKTKGFLHVKNKKGGMRSW